MIGENLFPDIGSTTWFAEILLDAYLVYWGPFLSTGGVFIFSCF